MRRSARYPLALLCAIALTGCDQVQQRLGIEDGAARAAKLEADGKAVGAGCRHSGRAIEDCYSIYQWLPRAAVFTGWQEMDGYMRENKITEVAPQLPPPPPPEDPKAKKKKPKPAPAADGEKKEESAAEKNGDKAADKKPAGT